MRVNSKTLVIQSLIILHHVINTITNSFHRAIHPIASTILFVVVLCSRCNCCMYMYLLHLAFDVNSLHCTKCIKRHSDRVHVAYRLRLASYHRLQSSLQPNFVLMPAITSLRVQLLLLLLLHQPHVTNIKYSASPSSSFWHIAPSGVPLKRHCYPSVFLPRPYKKTKPENFCNRPNFSYELRTWNL